MKSLYVLLLVSFSFNIIQAQEIQNGGFEEWENLIWTLNPMGWETNNSQVSTSVEPDSMSHSGEFAMRVSPFDFGTVSVGLASTTVLLTSIPEALNFYAKWEKTESCFVSVSITFFNDEVSFYNETWIPESNEQEWIDICIPLNQIEPIMTHAIIKVEVNIGDLIPGEGWLSIDDMQFGEANGINQLSSDLLEVSPVPCSTHLNLNYDEQRLENAQLNIFDIEGRMIYQNYISHRIDVSNLDSGNYIVQVLLGDEVIKKQFYVTR